MTGINQKGRYGRYIQVILTFVDFVILNLTFVITAHISPELIIERTRSVWLLANISYIPVAYIMANTQTARYIVIEHVLINSFKSVCLHAPIFVCGLYFFQLDHIPWYVFAEFYGILLIMFPLWWTASRLIIKHFRRKGRNYINIVIVGANPTGHRLFDEMESDYGFGYRVIGFFDDAPQSDTPDGMFRGTIDKLETYVTEHNVDEIFCVLPGDRTNDINNVLKIAEKNVIRYYYVPQVTLYASRNYELYAIGSVPVLSVRHQPLAHMRNRLLKRAFDITFASVTLIFSPLIFIPVAIAIKVSSPGPIFFKQKRTGYLGREFNCYKFRTMRVNSDSDKLQASKNDPRKTRVGEFLRHTSIDELPQFINVLLGNMSVVGPRPHMLKHTEEYRQLIDKYMVRHYIKPGITGWAQINGFRGQTKELWQMEKRVEHDVWYIENWSALLDLKIIFRTIYNAIQGEKNAF